MLREGCAGQRNSAQKWVSKSECLVPCVTLVPLQIFFCALHCCFRCFFLPHVERMKMKTWSISNKQQWHNVLWSAVKCTDQINGEDLKLFFSNIFDFKHGLKQKAQKAILRQKCLASANSVSEEFRSKLQKLWLLSLRCFSCGSKCVGVTCFC